MWSAVLLVCSVMATPPGVPARFATVDGQSIEAAWLGFADGQIQYAVATGQVSESEISASDLLSVRFPGSASLPTTKPSVENSSTIYLRDGSIFAGQILDSNARSAAIGTTVISRSLVVPLHTLRAVNFASLSPEGVRIFEEHLTKPDATQDKLLVLRDGKVNVLRGAVESLDRESIGFSWREKTVQVPIEGVVGVILAAGTGSSTAQTLCLLTDGSVWGGQLVGGDAKKIQLKLGTGDAVSFYICSVREIRFHSDRVLYLDQLQPTGFESQSMGLARWPWRANRSVANRPMKIADQSFERGVGMHSQSTLTYDLPPDCTKLVAIIGIDAAADELGNAIFRVLVDQKEIFNSGPVRRQDRPRPITIDLPAASQLQLVVDYGDNLDIGDQANWADARLIRTVK